MALFRISEPTHNPRLAIGIDLGTTYSLVSTTRNGVPYAIPDEKGEVILPSVVRYPAQRDIVVGAEARAAAIEDPANTIISVKRLIGRGLADIKERYPHLPYSLIETGSAVPRIQVAGGSVNAIEVSARILQTLRERAEAALGGKLYGAVITVPAYFDDAQRQATKDAARLAGLNVLRLLNEPTAAAIAYGLDSSSEGHVAVYDLGGGTFDISILSLENGVFQVLATAGDSALGGDDFDALIVAWIARQAGVSGMDKSLRRELTNAAIRAKEHLSVVPITELDIPIQGRRWQGSLDRGTLNELITPLLDNTLRICRRALRDAGLEKTQIDEVVMVGGSTRLPLVREKAAEFFQREVLTNIDPDQVVAMGAAIQADNLAGNSPENEMLLLDVIPLSLGIETMGGIVEKIIPRNSTLPISQSQHFTTFKDGQTAMAIHVVQGERELVADCRSLARFELRAIPPMIAGAARIKVTFQVDADGLLSVSAQELVSGISADVQVQPSSGLTEQEIGAMLQASIEHAKDDMEHRHLKEQQVQAERVLSALDAALAEDADALLTAEQKRSVLKVRARLVKAKEGINPAEIRRAIRDLEAASDIFVSRRMNAGIKQALAGHRVDEL